jgi:hypothetical protein
MNITGCISETDNRNKTRRELNCQFQHYSFIIFIIVGITVAKKIHQLKKGPKVVPRESQNLIVASVKR